MTLTNASIIGESILRVVRQLKLQSPEHVGFGSYSFQLPDGSEFHIAVCNDGRLIDGLDQFCKQQFGNVREEMRAFSDSPGEGKPQ
jgi:hypothetical protein